MTRRGEFGNDPQLLGGLPKVGVLAGAVHVFPPEAGRTPIAGPFPSVIAARWWIVEHLEQQFTPEQRAIWQDVMAHHTATADGGLELGVLDMVRHGRTAAQVAKYLPRARRSMPDRRMAAAGEPAELST